MTQSDSASTRMTVLLIHQDETVGRALRESMLSEGYKVVGPVNSVTAAYMAILNEDPDIAILDRKICGDQSEIMSDTLIQIGVEHIVLCCRPAHILKREIGHGAMRGIVMTPHKNMTETISHELCYLRAEKIRRDAQRLGLKSIPALTPL